MGRKFVDNPTRVISTWSSLASVVCGLVGVMAPPVLLGRVGVVADVQYQVLVEVVMVGVVGVVVHSSHTAP